MAVVREEIDPATGGLAAPVGRTVPAAAGYPPAPKLWLRSVLPRLVPDDPATLLITDFSREDAWTVTEERSIDDALRDMACAGIDVLLVVRSEVVIGLVTAEDIQGRRALELLQYSGFTSRGEIRVAHVMSPWGRVPVLDWRSVAASRVRQLEEWARNTRATHALVVDQLDGMEYVRGVLSRGHIERSLGCSL